MVDEVDVHITIGWYENLERCISHSKRISLTSADYSNRRDASMYVYREGPYQRGRDAEIYAYKYSKIEQRIITTPLSKPLANMILHEEQFYPWFAAIAVCNSRKFFFDNKNSRLYLYCTHAHEPQDHARAHTHTQTVCAVSHQLIDIILRKLIFLWVL